MHYNYDESGELVSIMGSSGSGKSTLASYISAVLHKQNILTYNLDGDNIRNGLNSDLGFSQSDRDENIRRVSEVAKLFIDSGIVVLAVIVSNPSAITVKSYCLFGAISNEFKGSRSSMSAQQFRHPRAKLRGSRRRVITNLEVSKKKNDTFFSCIILVFVYYFIATALLYRVH